MKPPATHACLQTHNAADCELSGMKSMSSTSTLNVDHMYQVSFLISQQLGIVFSTKFDKTNQLRYQRRQQNK